MGVREQREAELRYVERSRRTTAIHEAGHAQAAHSLGVRGIIATVDLGVDHGGHTRWQRPPGWTAAKEVAVALAGAAAVGADAGMPLRPSELESILELERRSDLVDRLRRDPALAEEARRMAERIAFEELASIRALADTLAGCVGLDVPSTEYEPGHDEV